MFLHLQATRGVLPPITISALLGDWAQLKPAPPTPERINTMLSLLHSQDLFPLSSLLLDIVCSDNLPLLVLQHLVKLGCDANQDTIAYAVVCPSFFLLPPPPQIEDRSDLIPFLLSLGLSLDPATVLINCFIESYTGDKKLPKKRSLRFLLRNYQINWTPELLEVQLLPSLALHFDSSSQEAAAHNVVPEFYDFAASQNAPLRQSKALVLVLECGEVEAAEKLFSFGVELTDEQLSECWRFPFCSPT